MGTVEKEGNGSSLQHSLLLNLTYRGAWSAIARGITMSRTWLSDEHYYTPWGESGRPSGPGWSRFGKNGRTIVEGDCLHMWDPQSLGQRPLRVSLSQRENQCLQRKLAPSWITALSRWRGICNLVKLWAMPCRATQDGQVIWRVVTKLDPVEKEMAIHSSILAWRTSRIVWKGKKIWHWKMRPGQRVSKMLLGKSRGQLLIAPKKMKGLGQSRNDAQLWMCLGVRVKSDAVKNSIA